jgi:hypothetical protein
MALLPLRVLHLARRIATTASLRLMVFCLISLAASWAALGQAGGMNDFRDSHVTHSYEEMAVRTVLDYGEVPLWAPWTCGGLYAMGGPQTRFASPTFVLSLAFGSRRAEPLVLFLFLVLGMEGFFRYARLKAGTALGAFVAAPFFALNGFYAVSWGLGWLNFFGFELVPWCLLGTRLLFRRRLAGIAILAGSFALMLGFGGTYPVPLTALFVSLEAVGGLWAQRTWSHRAELAGWLGAAALFILGTSAFRLWPIIDTLQSALRVMAGQPSHSPETVATQLLMHTSRGGEAGVFYLAPPILLLVAASFFSRRALVPWVAAFLSAWLATGYFFRLSLFEGLRALPLFSTLRYPERFSIYVSFFLSVLGAIGFGVVWRRARRSRVAAWAAVVMCGAAIVGTGMAVTSFDVSSQRVSVLSEPERVDQPFAQARGNRWSQGYFLALNRGSISCGEAYPVPMSPLLRGDLKQEEYLEDPSAGEVRQLSWSPNRLELEVRATRPVHLLVNQNWHPGWKSSVGEVVSREGLLGVSLPAGEHRVSLRFLPRSTFGGALVSVLAWGSLGFVGWWARKRGRLSPWRMCAIAIGPLAVWALLWVTWTEPPAPPVLTNPNGTPILVESLPSDATPVRANFSVPVELHGAVVPAGPDANGLLHFELFWKVNGNVPRAVGVFVHLVDEHGRMANQDHEVLAGTFFFKTAPRGRLLRDAFTVSALRLPPGKWRVLVGLWNSRGDGSRIVASTPEGEPIPEGRVLVGTFTVPP